MTVEHLSAFAGFVLARKNETLLRSDGSERFPEVKIERHR